MKHGNHDARRQRQRLRLLAATALALAPCWGRAAPAASALAPRRLKVAILDIAPFGWTDSNGKPNGLLAELSQRLGQESGLDFDYVVAPYPRAVAMVVSGDADLMISLMNTELERGARPLGVLFSLDIVLIARAGQPLESLADLRGKTVGHLRRAEYSPALLGESGILRYETSSNEQTVNMLVKGRIDAALGIRTGLYYTLRVLKVPPERLGPALNLGKRDAVVYYSGKRHEPEIAARLKRGIEAMRHNGTVAQLTAKYEHGAVGPQR